MLKKVLGTLAITAALLWSTPTHAFNEGEVIRAGEFCFDVDEAFMKRFTEIVMAEGVDGYMKILNDTSNECYDARLHGPDAILGLTLKRKLWEFTPPGMTIPVEMWEARDLSDPPVLVYTWLRQRQAPSRGA